VVGVAEPALFGSVSSLTGITVLSFNYGNNNTDIKLFPCVKLVFQF
jgi:hypothetical protein